MVVIRRSSPQRRGGGGQNSAYGSLRSFLTIDFARRCVVLGAALLAAQSARRRPVRFVRVPPKGANRSSSRRRLREYKPKSQLVVAAASGAAREVSGHRHPQPSADADLAAPSTTASMKGMEANNLQILVNLSGSFGDRLRRASMRSKPASTRTAWSCSRTSISAARSAPASARRRPSSSTTTQGRREGAEDFQGPRHVRARRRTASACRSTIRSWMRSGRRARGATCRC